METRISPTQHCKNHHSTVVVTQVDSKIEQKQTDSSLSLQDLNFWTVLVSSQKAYLHNCACFLGLEANAVVSLDVGSNCCMSFSNVY